MLSLIEGTTELAQLKNIPPAQLELVLRRAITRAYAEEYGLPETSIHLKVEKTFPVSARDAAPISLEQHPSVRVWWSSSVGTGRPELAEQAGESASNTPVSSGRRLVRSIRRLIVQGIQELQAYALFSRLISLEGQLVECRVQRLTARGVLMELTWLPQTLAYAEPVKLPGVWMPNSERVAGEQLEPGQRLTVILSHLDCREKSGLTENSQGLLPVSRWRWLASRTSTQLVEALIMLYMPGVEIKGIARKAGVLTKVAVDRLPGADELRAVREQLPPGERLYMVKWSADPATYIANALTPARISSRQVKFLSPAPAASKDLPSFESEGIAEVQVWPGQLGRAFGRQHVNLTLAEALTGWQIELVERQA